MSDVLVSIIMPVYNGARFLQKAVQGISAQDYKNIEFIAVDDGSTDNSLEKLKSLTRGINATVIRKENGGISSARNAGLDEALGKYVVFVDQDDSIPKDYISNLVKAAEEGSSDLVVGGTLETEDGIKYSRRDLREDAPYSLLRNTAPWGRIFLRSLIEDNSIRFMDTRVSEDLYFNIMCITHAKNPKVIRQSGYVWKIDPNSESHSNMSRLKDDRTTDVLAVLDRSLQDMNRDKRDKNIDYMLLKHCVWYLLFTCKGADREDIKDTYGRMKLWLDTNIKDYKTCCGHKIGSPGGETFKIRFIVRFMVFLNRTGLLLKFLYLLR